jgi:hypothetical protein
MWETASFFDAFFKIQQNGLNLGQIRVIIPDVVMEYKGKK